MADSIESRRLFLIASGSNEERVRLTEIVESHISNTVIFTATDGSDAILKLGNAPPHILIVDPNLNKVNGWQLVTHVLEDRRFKETAIIILAPVPEFEKHIDEVVVGRVQFIEPQSELDLSKGIAKALNFVSHGEVGEFHLRFLAPGDILLKEGEKGQFIYLVRRGSLRAYLNQGKGELTIGKIHEGEFLGEMAYINNEPRSADVIAVTDCELIEIPMDHLDQLLFLKPSWAKALMITLSNRVKQANENLRQKVSS